MMQAKDLVKSFYKAIDASSNEDILTVMEKFCDPGYSWRGSHPFNELESATAVCEKFWKQIVQMQAM